MGAAPLSGVSGVSGLGGGDRAQSPVGGAIPSPKAIRLPPGSAPDLRNASNPSKAPHDRYLDQRILHG